MELLSYTLDVLGKVMIAYTAIAVHYRVRKEHKIDEKVFRTMRGEHWTGIMGIILILMGYFIKLPGLL